MLGWFRPLKGERDELENWERIEGSRERWNVLRHPFYKRWSAGELSADDLARYSGQYRHAVEAIAELSESADGGPARAAELRSHAAEERGTSPSGTASSRRPEAMPTTRRRSRRAPA